MNPITFDDVLDVFRKLGSEHIHNSVLISNLQERGFDIEDIVSLIDKLNAQKEIAINEYGEIAIK